jgi:geranylgeranyl reductase family protein
MGVLDVVVVGAGPAGSAAAITAARAGLSVTVLDKARFPRDKTCGDGLTAQAVRLLGELGLDASSIVREAGGTRVQRAVLVGPTGRQVDVPLADGLAVVAPRRTLDAALAARVHDWGVDLREGVAVREVVPSSDSVKLSLDGSEVLDARFVIAADGHWSTVRRALHPETPPDLGEWHAVRQYFDDAGDGRLWVIFDGDVLPGYAWVFPLGGGRANVGFGVLRADVQSTKRGRDLKALWPELLARPALQRALGANAQPSEPVRAWPIPTRYDASSLSDGRVLFVGDAARVVDPMTGEGIAQALETGMLAARAVARGGGVTERYRSDVAHALGRDLRFASALQRILRHPLGARAALRAVDLNAWTRRQFGRWMFEDYPRATVLTPSRWRALRTAS